MEIEEFTAEMAGEWDAFVLEQPDGTLFHLSPWFTVLRDSTPLRPIYLIAKSNGKLVGLMPMAHVRSRMFGNMLSSTPFCMKGGPLGSFEARQALLTYALDLGRSLHAGFFEVRAASSLEDSIEVSDSHCYFTKPISQDDDENLKAIPRKQRAMVRKGIKAGLVSRIEESLDNFFHIYSTSVRNLGTPVFPKRYFLQLKSAFGSACEITTVYNNDQSISSVMSFRFRDQIMPLYGGGLPIARNLKAYDFMYWEVMRRAAAEGVTTFDYGRSKIGSGSYSFKKNWGFEPEPLTYSYALITAKSVPNRNPMSKKYQLAVSAWKKLPLAVANRIGPAISPYLA